MSEMTLREFLQSFLCPVSIEIQGPCKSGHIEFNDSASPQLFQWDGTAEELQEWLQTPWGAMSMVEARQRSPVHIYIVGDDATVDLWPGVTVVE